jgi:hypothetical protein
MYQVPFLKGNKTNILQLNNGLLPKGCLISEGFPYWLQSHKKCAKNYPEHLFFRWVEHRIVIWGIFWEIGAKVKNFLRLSHI